MCPLLRTVRVPFSFRHFALLAFNPVSLCSCARARRKVVEPELAARQIEPQAAFMHEDLNRTKRASSPMQARRSTLCRCLYNFFSFSQAPAKHMHAQPRTLSMVLTRVVLVATVAACAVATALFIGLAEGDLHGNSMHWGSGARSRSDARLLTQGDDWMGGSISTESGAKTESKGTAWLFTGFSALWGSAKDRDRQLREKLENSGQNYKKRVALLFFGLPRSLPYTMPSIERQLMRPLRDTGYTPTVFVHTFAGKGVPAKTSESWTLLKPFDHIISEQKQFLDMRQCAPCTTTVFCFFGCVFCKTTCLFIYSIDGN